MSRRSLSLGAVLLVALLTTGCASDVAPALRVGDGKISIAAFQDELEGWAASPTLVSLLGAPSSVGAAPGSYSTDFVNAVLNLRVSFEIHNAQFKAMELALPAGALDDVRGSLFGDPATAATVFGELTETFADDLIADVARQGAVSEALAADYDTWAADAFSTVPVEVNPRYGSWEPQAGVLPPIGPLPAPAGS